MCSWNNPKLLKATVDSLCESLDLSKDGIAVTLNQSDSESIEYLLNLKIPFVSLPENRGVLAIDYLKPFAENSEFFMNSNDDMIFHEGFAEEVLSIMENHYPCSVSVTCLENFNSNNPCVVVDEELLDFNDVKFQELFKEKANKGLYKRDSMISSFSHPICVKSSDFIKTGGYSGYWDMDFFTGYARDCMFPYELLQIHGGNFKFIQTKKSCVFHASGATMAKLKEEFDPKEWERQNGHEAFRKRTGMYPDEFQRTINLFSTIQE